MRTLLQNLLSAPHMAMKLITSWGAVVNFADELASSAINIARGNMQGARLFSSYGERTTVGAETEAPVWPDGAITQAPYNAGVTIQSTSANDTAEGTGIQALHLHYIRQDLSEVDDVIIELNGVTPVPLNDPEFLFMQCMHIVPKRVGAGLKAAGTITAKDGTGTYIYSEIATGAVRCSSGFRMVPGGKRLFIDGAVGSSISGTATARTLLRIVANHIAYHRYDDPVIFIPHASIGIQDGAITASFIGGLGPFPAGTIVGCVHTTDKAATISCSWFGRLEPEA